MNTYICQADIIFVFHYENGIKHLPSGFCISVIFVAVNDINFQIVWIMLQGQMYGPVFIDASN